MKVRSVGVRRVWDCMLCACVSEEGGDGEGAGSEAPSLLSYILRYVILAELGTLCRAETQRASVFFLKLTSMDSPKHSP